MAKKSYDYLFKYLLIGDSDVGKTCILFRFCDDAFNATFISTIGIDFKIKTVQLDGKRIKLQIWDTAGQERFQTITTSYYRGANGIMLVYDIANQRSFKNLIEWIKNIREHANDDLDIMVMANKHDLESQRVISTEQGKALAEANGLQYIETSAKENVNIEKAFMDLTQAVLQKTLNEETEEVNDNRVNLEAESGSKSCC